MNVYLDATTRTDRKYICCECIYLYMQLIPKYKVWINQKALNIIWFIQLAIRKSSTVSLVDYI